jgi:hypothetical protein
MFNYDDLMQAVSGNVFDERPVDIEEFIYGFDYLNMTNNGQDHWKMGEEQLLLVKNSSQIYKRETLIELYGEIEGAKRYKTYTKREIIAQWGKGGGKDATSVIAVAYIVYQLLCLRDPATYYGKPSGESIDILNIAINAQQAQRVFFDNFAVRIEKSKWFQGRWEKKSGHFAFDKNVNVYSGHSEREAFEGYNVLYVVLDEIAGFALNSDSGNVNAKTAKAIYDMYRKSVTSRFPQLGKIVLLSFPRFKGDFIQQRYDAVILEKETVVMRETLKLDPDLPDGIEANEFVVEWEHDEIESYHMPGIWALKRASWEVNPTKDITDYTSDFFDDYIDSLSRFACMPPESIDGLFKDREKIEAAFSAANGVNNETGVFYDWFQPQSDKTYYVHVDLALKHDRCAVSLAHVEKWEQKQIGGGMTEPAPVIHVDAVRYWTPTAGKNVNFVDVRNYIVSLRQRGFNVRLVTFDRWRSDDMIEFLNGIGMRAEVLSVAIAHYTDLVMVVQEQRISAPAIELLKNELMKLRIMPTGKVDHPRNGSKDLADATCGAVYNAIAHTPRTKFDTIEIVTAESLRAEQRTTVDDLFAPSEEGFGGVIRPPKGKSGDMPPELSSWIDGMKVL